MEKITMAHPGVNFRGHAPYRSDEAVPLNSKGGDSTKYKIMESEYNKSTETFGKKAPEDIADGKTRESEDELLERGHWTGKLDFMLALIGFSVGLGNVWRFPYLCYKNGGGAFLIPYFLCLALGGIPLLILEIGLGQFTAQGGVTSWRLLPVFKGIGGANIVILTYLNTYYTVIMAWALYYMIMSFTKVVPWSKCDNEWNTELCFVPGVDELKNCTSDVTDMTPTVTPDYVTEVGNGTCIDPSDRVSSTVEFWERKILQIHLSTGIDDLGGINWQLMLCLMGSWVLVYLCICKGVKSSGKVVYFTAPFPYVLLTILLVRAVTLDNAVEGIIFYLKPDLSKLGESQVDIWVLYTHYPAVERQTRQKDHRTFLEIFQRKFCHNLVLLVHTMYSNGIPCSLQPIEIKMSL
ncbi:Creatine transporter [Holothuria leucospilota]|uniref:Transporter n=1 Tax=Holothuria leucospilota TaxID=206669 RepID=A0A9Q1CJ95_HOLLE|nr:Creatine transporter [Holothuria leucospilota]